MSTSVIDTFVRLYNKGLIYRGYRMVNWDPEAKTTLSDEEVIYEEQDGQLYHIAYAVVDSDEKAIIAPPVPKPFWGIRQFVFTLRTNVTSLKGKVNCSHCQSRDSNHRRRIRGYGIGTGCLGRLLPTMLMTKP